MTVELLTEQHLEFVNLKGGCTGSSESTLVKLPHSWKSHVVARIYNQAGMSQPLKQAFTLNNIIVPRHRDFQQCSIFTGVDSDSF